MPAPLLRLSRVPLRLPVLMPLLSVPLLILLLLLLAGAASDAELVRITQNGVEDRTGSGSMVRACEEHCAVWEQAQAGPGWRLMWSDDLAGDWAVPAPVDPGQHPDYGPRVVLADQGGQAFHMVWQRDTGNAAEIMFASRTWGGEWTVEAITANTTEDVSPDISSVSSPPGVHVTWAGFDPQSGGGKIFYATRAGATWQIEKVAASQLGPFWTGAAPKIAVDPEGIVHIVYRGGDYGNYHAHYGRREPGGVWTTQILGSGNANDFSVDVTVRGEWPLRVAMSGNDGWGFPSHIYLRESEDGGLTFGPPELVSGTFSAQLDAIGDGLFYGAAIVGSEVSGNIYTGNLLISAENDGWAPELLPPASQSSSGPSISQALCVTLTQPPPGMSVLYTDTGGQGSEAAEVFILTAPLPGGAGDPGAPPRPAGLRISAAPNPFSTSTWITLEGGDGELAGVPAAAVTLRITDVLGRLVWQASSASPHERRPGAAAWQWRGNDGSGRPLPSGAYFVEIETGGRTTSRRVLLVR